MGFVFIIVFFGMQFGIFNVRGSNISRNASLGITVNLPQDCTDSTEASCDWNKTEEWNVLSTAFTKDSDTINKVSTLNGLSYRMIIATVASE